MSLVLGLLTIVLASLSLTRWFADSSLLVKILFPVSFICGGIIAVLAQIRSLKK